MIGHMKITYSGGGGGTGGTTTTTPIVVTDQIEVMGGVVNYYPGGGSAMSPPKADVKAGFATACADWWAAFDRVTGLDVSPVPGDRASRCPDPEYVERTLVRPGLPSDYLSFGFRSRVQVTVDAVVPAGKRLRRLNASRLSELGIDPVIRGNDEGWSTACLAKLEEFDEVVAVEDSVAASCGGPPSLVSRPFETPVYESELKAWVLEPE
jgi:hypothetical protein